MFSVSVGGFHSSLWPDNAVSQRTGDDGLWFAEDIAIVVSREDAEIKVTQGAWGWQDWEWCVCVCACIHVYSNRTKSLQLLLSLKDGIWSSTPAVGHWSVSVFWRL